MPGPRLSIAVFAALFFDLLSVALPARHGALDVRIGGADVPRGRVMSLVVDCDGESPDRASMTVLSGTTAGVGLAIEVAAADGQAIFKGEIVDIQPVMDGSGRSKVVIRAFNRLHRLTRGTRTRTFERTSDARIARQLAFEAGLKAETPGMEASIEHDRVYQHNQTDLEFLLERAARLGYEVFADETTLHFRKRRNPPPTEIGCQLEDVALEAFRVGLSSPASVKEVTVRGWDPVKQEEIVGRARQGAIAIVVGSLWNDKAPAGESPCPRKH